MIETSQSGAKSGPITALEFLARIRARCSPPLAGTPPDDVIAGDPTTAITGIATTAMASVDCLKAAAASGSNLVITMEPAFWSDNDTTERLGANAAFQAKREFLRTNATVCFRLRNHWPATGPNGIAVGMAKELGWERYTADPADPTRFSLPPTTLLDLAKYLAATLNDRTLRVVGDPALPVSRVAAAWGNASRLPTIRLLNQPVDVVLAGYTHEWEAVEYAQDMISAGKKKALILLGATQSEQAGMKQCAEWLKTFISEVPVEYIPLAEPYWNLSGRSPS